MAADSINWYPQHMKNRYILWVENLKWDWCISRQRYFGVPFPIWYCKNCGKVMTADEEKLPVNPIEEYWNGDIPWLSSGEIAQFPIRVSEKNITELGMNKSATSFAEKGSILLSITRYIRASILAVDACFNQSVVAIKSNEELPTVFLYPFVESKIPLYMSLRTGLSNHILIKEL